MNQIKSSSYFKSLVLINCIIGILPLLLLGYISYAKSSDLVKDEATEGNRLILQQNKSHVESYLKTIDTLATQSISGPLTADQVSMHTVLNLPFGNDNGKLFKGLINKIVAIQVFELGVEDIHLISFRQDWLIERGVVYPMQNRDLTQRNQRLYQLKQMLIEYRDDQKPSYWRVIEDRDENYVLKLVKHIPLNSSDPSGLMTVNIPMKEISSRLTKGGHPGMTLLLDSAGNVLSHSDSLLIGSNVRSEPYYAELLNRDKPDGFFSYKINDEPFVVIYNRSKYNQWIYAALIPLDHITEKSQIIRGYTLISAGIIIGLIVIMSFATSFRMYLPIRRIHGFMKPNMTNIKGNELQHIGDQVQHMVQSQSRMVDEIESLNRQARDYFVFKLLQGEIKVADADDFLEKYGYPIDWEQWCILAIQIDSLDDTGYTTNDHDWLMYAIQNMVEELVPSTNRLSPIVQNKCLLLFCGAPMDEMRSLKVQVFQYAESIQQNVRHYLKLKISVGISRAYWGFAHTSLAYQESLEALTYRVRLGPESILFIDEAQPERQDHLRYPKELEFNIIEAVRQLEHDRAKANLEQIIACFFEKHVNHNDYQILLGRLFNNLIGIVQDAGASVRDVFQSDIFQSDIMLSMHSPQDIRKWFEQEILDPLLRWMEVQHRKHDINISQEIINAIHQEYDKDLSIELFASRLNYHPSYISRVFKKDTGITFTDYLTQYRIELSKKWLKDTNMKISDIAEKLRYSAAPSFNRSFKKSVKITPSQYREQFNKQLGDD